MGYADKTKQAEYQRNWMRKRREAWFADKSCERCGTTENLELDHLDPQIKVTHRIWSWRADRREAELAKCRALCQRHHMERTIEQLSTAQHGVTVTLYDDYGCRCEPCRAVKRAKQARNRRR